MATAPPYCRRQPFTKEIILGKPVPAPAGLKVIVPNTRPWCNLIVLSQPEVADRQLTGLLDSTITLTSQIEAYTTTECLLSHTHRYPSMT
jgi:hypothetical protein